MRRRVALIALALAALLVAPGVANAQATSGGCAAFGANVSGLATKFGGDFGGTASFVAQSGPAVFPNAVVFPEQAALC